MNIVDIDIIPWQQLEQDMDRVCKPQVVEFLGYFDRWIAAKRLDEMKRYYGLGTKRGYADAMMDIGSLIKHLTGDK